MYDINIPRWFGFEKELDDRIDLNIFCDASSESYAPVAYVNYLSQISKKHISSFLLSKSRLLPIKKKKKKKKKFPDNTPLRAASCCISNPS